ncbi:GntR family transcriptional regulator [Pimelobacter simplex]|uniref:GntR family transcriptional regulator n=1 Tax=Nocardioides simplex TaxID=2045 RepID=UPI003AAEC74A
MPAPAVLAQKAYEAVRTGILSGDLRPNQRLVEAEVCDLIGIGRTPVRGALQMLENHGYLIKQRSSWTVREFGPQDIKNVYETRMALEGFAARLTVERATDEEIARIAAILESHADLETLPPDEQVSLNSSFHDAIADASGNEHLARLIRRDRHFAFDYSAAKRYTADDYRHGHAGHHEIVAALQARDADAAERLVVEHYRLALEAQLRFL